MVDKKIKAVLAGEKKAESIVAKAGQESEESLKNARSRAAELMKEAEAAAEKEKLSLESKADKESRADLDESRRLTEAQLKAIDKKAGEGFEAAVKLVQSQLI